MTTESVKLVEKWGTTLVIEPKVEAKDEKDATKTAYPTEIKDSIKENQACKNILFG